MRHHRCDQFAADMLHVRDAIKKKSGKTVNFVPAQVNNMVQTIVQAGNMTMEHDELKQFVLDHYNLSDEEWSAHEQLLHRIFERRKAAA